MREILFRGKDIAGNWHYGDLINLTEELKQICNHNQLEHAHSVNPETVGQYTGLTDKNGKKIFEGDIIRGFMDYGPAGLIERIVSVSWHDKYGYQWNYFDTDTIEVIGNIHDTPELLKGE